MRNSIVIKTSAGGGVLLLPKDKSSSKIKTSVGEGFYSSQKTKAVVK